MRSVEGRAVVVRGWSPELGFFASFVPLNPAAAPFELTWAGDHAEVEFDGLRVSFVAPDTVAAWCEALVSGRVRARRKRSGGFFLSGTAADGERLGYRVNWLLPPWRRSRVEIREWEPYDIPPKEDP